MWAWIKTIFGAPEVVSTVATGVKTGFEMLDKAFYTDQEKAENANKVVDVWLKLQMILANDNSIAALTRRLIAFLVVSEFCFLLLVAVASYHWNKDLAEFILKIIIDGYLGYLVLGICGTYFTFYGWGKYVSKENVPYSTASIDAQEKK
jgi:hypothetical protein